jgi:hypothetical protein
MLEEIPKSITTVKKQMIFGFLTAFVLRFRFCGTWSSVIWKIGTNTSGKIETSVFKAEEDGTTTSFSICQTPKLQIPEESNLVSGFTEIGFQQ